MPLRLAAAWQQGDGGYRIGLLEAQPGSGTALRALHALEIPTRAHGLCPLPDGSIVAASRRPGDWLLRWWPGTAREPVWQWSDGQRSFNGHVIASPDARLLLSTETEAETGRSLVVLRDAASLEMRAEWSTQGIDAHELIWDRRAPVDGTPTLIVANGGVPTAPETGRVKRALDTMDSSIVRLHGGTGETLGQWRLQDRRLSLRHLAWNPGADVLGIALQAEHDGMDARAAAPVLALFDGKVLRTADPAPQVLPGGLRGVRRQHRRMGGRLDRELPPRAGHRRLRRPRWMATTHPAARGLRAGGAGFRSVGCRGWNIRWRTPRARRRSTTPTAPRSRMRGWTTTGTPRDP